MLTRKALISFVAAASLAHNSYAADVFAHYMVGTVTPEHAQKDVNDAILMGLDGFALNIGDATQSFVNDTLQYLFAAVEGTDFKLYVSMDVYASGSVCFTSQTSCNGPFDYSTIFGDWKGHPNWYIGPNGFPMISTFSSGGIYSDEAPIDTWTRWKESLANEMYFIPDFDETSGYYNGTDGWWYYWESIMDGVFSWESAWPERAGYGGAYPGDVGPDVIVLEGAKSRGKGYMMGLSALQYKNSYGTNVYRAGDDNLPARMTNILSMSPQPDFVQIITWNDGPESHYIGNLWPEQNNDTQPAAYATSHISANSTSLTSSNCLKSLFPSSTDQACRALVLIQVPRHSTGKGFNA